MAIGHSFFMDLASLWQDLLIGFLIAGALAAWVPGGFWQAFFLTDHPVLAQFWGPLIGPVISMLSFVCSARNGPPAPALCPARLTLPPTTAVPHTPPHPPP